MLDDNTLAPADPKTDVSVTFGGVKYSMQIGTLCCFELSAMNVDPSDVFAGTERDRRVTSFAHVLKLFRATIAHNFVAAKKPVPSVEELAMLLDSEPRELLTEISNKTMELIFPKLWAMVHTIKLQEPAPTTEPAVN